MSGHRELAERTGAEIVFGAQRRRALFPHRAVRDGDEIRLGQRRAALPGDARPHARERLRARASTPRPPRSRGKVLTGDTLFIGDVGRPDLACGRGRTPTQMAGLLYDSLHGKLLALPTRSRSIPRTARARCAARNISKETSSTIGEQRRVNYALQPMPRERVRARC